MTGLEQLETCFLPLDRRAPRQARFFRVIGRDGAGRFLALLERYRAAAEREGVCLEKLANPSEAEIRDFSGKMGPGLALGRPQMERQTALWLGQLHPSLRPLVTGALWDAVDLLRRQGVNEHILKNVYTKFMCWLRSPLGHVLTRLGGAVPPKILFTGDISKHEALFLHLLHQTGCDVWYVNFLSSAAYDAADPGGQFSQLIDGEIRTAPPAAPPARPAPAPAPRPVAPAPTPAPRPAAPTPPSPTPAAPPMRLSWENAGRDLLLNDWAEGRPVWEAILLPNSQRTGGDASKKRRVLFAVLLGADGREVYRNRLFRLNRALEDSTRTYLLVEKKFPPPTPEETSAFRINSPGLSRPRLIQALAERMPGGKSWTAPAQRALALVMERLPAESESRYYNYSVRLACWLKRYAEQLFNGGPGQRAEYPPALVYYGPITEPEVSLLWALAQMGADVLYISSEKHAAFSSHFLPHLWLDASFPDTLPQEPFPRREEKLRARTTAYDAAQELDHLLYNDTGMFRDRQFARSQPVTLKTTYDEVAQLWPEEAQYRPSFRTEDGVVYVPNLFSKICGVEHGDVNLYWDRIQAMRTPSTYLVTTVPFLPAGSGGLDRAAAQRFLHNGRLDPVAVKASPHYRYGYLPEDTQNYLLEKVQALMDYDLIIDGGPDLPAVTLSVLMNLDKDLLRLIQSFDFTRTIPKFLAVDVTETLFSLEECVLLAFLNLIGFDIAIFTPTGYRNLEAHIRPDSYDTLAAGDFLYDLNVPDFRYRRPAGDKGKPGWKRFLFGD